MVWGLPGVIPSAVIRPWWVAGRYELGGFRQVALDAGWWHGNWLGSGFPLEEGVGRFHLG